MLKLDKQELSKKENANLIRLGKLEESIIKKIEKLNKKYEKADRTRLDLNNYLKEIQDKRDAYESHIINTTHAGSFEFIKTQIPKFDEPDLCTTPTENYYDEKEFQHRMEIVKKFSSVAYEDKFKCPKRDLKFLNELAESVSIVGSDAHFEVTNVFDKDVSNHINSDKVITEKDDWLNTAHNLGMELSTNECDLNKASKVELDWKQISENCKTDGNTEADFDSICNSSITKKQEEMAIMEDIYNNVNENNEVWRNSSYKYFSTFLDEFDYLPQQNITNLKALYEDDLSASIYEVADDTIITNLRKEDEKQGIINAALTDIPEDKGDICEDIYETVADSVGTGIYWDDDFTKEAKEYVLKNYEELNKNKYDKSVISIKSYDKASDKVLKSKSKKIDLSDINIVG